MGRVLNPTLSIYGLKEKFLKTMLFKKPEKELSLERKSSLEAFSLKKKLI